MNAALLVLHVLIAAGLIAIVLLQKSEGGALGMGGGGGMMTGRGTANLLTRMTMWLAGAFFATSVLLALIATQGSRQRSIFDPQPVQPGQTGVPKPGQPPGQAPAVPSPGGSGAPAPNAPKAPGPALPTPPK